MIVVFVFVVRQWKSLSAVMRYLFVFSAPPLACFLLFSLHRDVNPNWPLMFYLAALMLVGGFCVERAGRFERWMKYGVCAGAPLAVLFYVAMAILPLEGQDLTRIAPLREVSGWSQLGEAIGRVQASLPDPDAKVIVAGHRYYTAATAFYHPQRPRVYNWNDHEGVKHQYDLWPWMDSFSGNALIVVSDGKPLPPELAARFTSVEPLETITIPKNGKKPKRAGMYYAKGWIRENTQ
jgi:hypothetical protein